MYDRATFTRVQRRADDVLLRVAVDDGVAGLSEQTTIDLFHRPQS